MQAARASNSCKHRAGSQPALAHSRAPHQSKPQRQATAASTEQATNLCWLTQEPCTNASHTKQQLQAQSKQLTCAGPNESPAPRQATKASDSCKHIASFKPVLAHTGALHQCKPQKQETVASTEQAANTCWLEQGPSAKASHKGKRHLQAHSKQLTYAGSHRCPAPMQATRASNSCGHRASS